MKLIIQLVLAMSLLVPSSMCFGMGFAPTLPPNTDITTGADTSVPDQNIQSQQQAQQALNSFYQMLTNMMQQQHQTQSSAIANLR